jgi:aldehyde:ferredoxin oxidoreductase
MIMSGKSLMRVNLTTGAVSTEPLKEAWLKDFIGGRGYATKLLFEELSPGVDPLSPENKLVLAVGPLSGSNVPTGGRSMAATKSPLTGFIACSNTGGQWGAEFARTGNAFLVVEGRAEKPVYLWIKDDRVEIRDAGAVWGQDTAVTTDRLPKEVGDDRAKVACIGPAGERGSKIACIVNDKTRAMGRSGVGAVMGSKNLKAVVVRGSKTWTAVDPEGLKEALRIGMQKIKENGVTSQGLPAYGTAVLVNIVNAAGSFPYRNFQSGFMPEADRQSGETLAATLLTGKRACYACPIACGRGTKVGDKEGEGPEYESTWSLGANCGVVELETITLANYLCNELGLDTISAGGTVSAAMELYEKGFLPASDLEGGPKPRFGSGEALLYWVEKMGKAEGRLGRLLAEGSARLCEAYGHPEFSITVKKQELPAYDPRGIQGIGLTYATSNRGACHVRGYMISAEVLGVPQKLDPWVTEGKPEWTKAFNDLTAAIDSSGMCLFTSFALSADDYAAFLKAGAGLIGSTEELMRCGERIWNLERLFNLREGLDPKKDDTLPKRLLEEPLPDGAAKGMVSRVPEMMPEYYRARGWDERGVPTEAKLRELGLEVREGP